MWGWELGRCSRRLQRGEGVLALECEVASGGGEAVKRSLVNDDRDREVGAGRIVRRRESGAGETVVFGKEGVPEVVIDFEGGPFSWTVY